MKYVQSQQKSCRRRSDVFIINFEHISHLLVFLLSILSRVNRVSSTESAELAVETLEQCGKSAQS